MKKITISEFKSKCNTLLEQISKTKRPLLITRYGRPIAEIRPLSIGKRKFVGAMAGTGKILAYLVNCSVISIQ